MTDAEDDPPNDAVAVLSQLFAETRTALESGDVETARETVDSAESVVATKLPAGDRRSRLRYGCERVRALLSEESDETAAAVEYLDSMERRLPEQ